MSACTITQSDLDAVTVAAVALGAVFALGGHWITREALWIGWRFFRRSRRRAARARREAA